MGSHRGLCAGLEKEAAPEEGGPQNGDQSQRKVQKGFGEKTPQIGQEARCQTGPHVEEHRQTQKEVVQVRKAKVSISKETMSVSQCTCAILALSIMLFVVETECT